MGICRNRHAGSFRSAHRRLAGIVLACALGAGVAACGSSSTNSSASTTPTSTPATSSSASSPAPSGTAEATSGAAAEQAIAANWAAFFSAKTPVAKRVSLLQGGQAFASIITSQATSPLASAASAKVTKVTLESGTQAKVIYTILVSGQPALSNQTGVAVYQDGTWKVGVASFCGLLTLENGGKTSGLPAACTSSAG